MGCSFANAALLEILEELHAILLKITIALLKCVQYLTCTNDNISDLKKATTILCEDKKINEELRNGEMKEVHVSNRKKYKKIPLRPALYLMFYLQLSITCTTGYVVLSPQNNTVFENNALAVFYCIGNGSAVGWYLNGTAYNDIVHIPMGITFLTNQPIGGVVSSSLYIRSNSTNNNTKLFCKVIDGTFTYIQLSAPANLTIQGRLDAPYNFSVARSNTSFILGWDAPFSLSVFNSTKIIFNYTLCTNITIYGCKTIPSDQNCTFPWTCTSSVDFTDPSQNDTNKTIMDYGDPIKFTFAAINGAGIGNMTEYIFNGINDKDSRTQVSPSPTKAVIISTISYTNNSTSDHSIGLILGGVISGAAVIVVVLSLVIATIATITCCFIKKKSHFKPSSEYNDYCTQSIRVELTDPVYFLPLSDFRPATCTSQGADKSCIEFGIQHKSNKEQYKVESGYADVVCVPIFSIPAPKQEVAYSDVVAHNTVTPSHPPSGRKSRNPSPHRVESDGDDEGIEDQIMDLVKDDLPKAFSYPSTKRSPHQRRIQSDGDEEDAQPSEQISSTPPSTCRCDNVVSPAESNKEKTSELPMPINRYSCPSTKRSRIECDGDEEDVDEKTNDLLMKKEKLQDWCQSSTTEKQATVPQQFTSGVLVETGCEDSKRQKTNQRTISEVIKCDENSLCALPFTHFYKTEHTEGHTLSTSKESDLTNDDEGGIVEQCDWRMHMSNIVRPHYVRPADMPVLSSIVPSVTFKVSFEKCCNETGCVIHIHEILNESCLDTCSANDDCANGTKQAQVTLEVEKACQRKTKDTLLGDITSLKRTLPQYTVSKAYEKQPHGSSYHFGISNTIWSIENLSKAYFKKYEKTKFGAAGVGKTQFKHFLQKKDPPEQRISTGLADNPVKDQWFVFQVDTKITGNIIKCGLDHIFTIAIMARRLISLLLLMSGDIEENPGPEGPEGHEGKDPTFTHKNVVNTLKDVVEWKSLGVQLHISAPKIKEIDINKRGQVAECRRVLLQYWLQSDVSCSWKKLIDAFKSIDKSVLAEEIIRTYCPMYQDPIFTHKNVVNDLKDVVEWKSLGVQLDISALKIKKIDVNNQGQVTECRLDLVLVLLESDVSCSWKKLIYAHEAIGKSVLAEEIIRTYCPMYQVAVISKLLISLLLLMSGDIEENPGPEGPEGEGNDERLKYSEFIATIVQYASDRITEDIKKKINTVCVIILACRENELRASAVEMIEEENIIQVDNKTGTKLYLGKLADCACGIVVTGQGKHSKSDVKEILKTCINAKLIISLGVTAGLGKSKLDDVLIATKIAHYDEGKVQNDGFFSDGETKNVYKIVEKIFSQAALFTWDFPCAINWRKSKYISGLIDSDPYLLDSKLWVDRMGITNAEAKGYEMEGHILQWIAEEEENRDLNFIIILKCVCDFANGSKSKEWQYTGAKAAASYTKTRLTMSETYKSSIVASHYLNISNEKKVKDHQSNAWKTYMQLVKANMVYSSPSNDRSFANANLICRSFQCPIFGDDENGWCQNSISKKEATVPQQFTSDVLVETGSVPQQFTCDKTGSCVWPFIHVQLQNEHSEGHTLPTSKESDISNDASSIDEGRIMEQGDMWNIIWTRTETKFGAAGVDKMRLQHFPMNDHPEQCFGTVLADNSIKDMFSSLEQHWVLLQIFIQLIGKAIKAMVSCYLKIMVEKEVKDQAKTWKTYIQAVKAIGGSVVFWLPLDVAYGALDVQALYAKGIVE